MRCGGREVDDDVEEEDVDASDDDSMRVIVMTKMMMVTMMRTIAPWNMMVKMMMDLVIALMCHMRIH